ncbi:MAG: DUF2851 family protein [Bacteroidota bacterium]
MHKEELLHFVWKKGLFPGKSLITTNGIELDVIHPGEENLHAGPDFFNARIRLGRLVWAGNVEIHRFASDWNKHGHQLDPAYDNVILHVIYHFDTIVRNSKGRQIPSLVVDRSDSFMERVDELRKNESWIPCSSYIHNVPARILKSWINTLSAERMALKVANVSRLLARPEYDRLQVLYLTLASGFGLPINNLPFEMLASGIPLSLLLEIRDNLNDLEAVLFGSSGLLHSVSYDEGYVHSLKHRYKHIMKEFPGKPVPEFLWKFHRIRPASFPTLRLSQFASLIHTQFPLDIDQIRTWSLSEIENKLKVNASKYWNTHYTFGRPSPFLIKKFGRQAATHLLINAFIPFLKACHEEDQKKRVFSAEHELFQNLEAESNHIVKNWIKFGLSPCSAFESQALIQLYKGYCIKRRCSECGIGRVIFGAEVHEK